MKKTSKVILLSSFLLASLSLYVGSTVATYVVNDNANTVGIKIGMEEVVNPTVSYYMPNSSGVFSISGDPVEASTSTFNVVSNAPNTPNIDNYKFVEWCTDANLTTAAGSSIEVTEDTTLYAKYVGYFLSKEEGSSPSDYNQLVIQPNGSFLYEGAHTGDNAQIYRKLLKSDSTFLTDCSNDGSGVYHCYDNLVTASGQYKVTLSSDISTFTIQRKVGLKFTGTNWKANDTEYYSCFAFSGEYNEWSAVVTSSKNSSATEYFYIAPWYPTIIFVRLSSATANWDNKWNQSGDISLTDKGYSSTNYIETCTAWDNFANNFSS